MSTPRWQPAGLGPILSDDEIRARMARLYPPSVPAESTNPAVDYTPGRVA
jgi:hypothetical protein